MSYSDIYSSFTWPRPERFNFAVEVIDRWAQKPEKQAMLWVDDAGNEVCKTFREISEASCRLANVLSNAGVARGDTVVVMLGRQIAWWETVTACLRMGVVVSPGTMQLAPNDLAYRINTAETSAIVTDAVGAEKLEQVLERCPSLRVKLVVGGARDGWIDYDAAMRTASDRFRAADTAADEAALCYFTSGTTGYPKMAIHSHSYGLAHLTTGKYWLDLKEDDLHWNISDTGWAKAAWSSYFGPWNCGAAIFVHHTSGFDADKT
ncbi:MAG: AMP-binding protein, partial [Pseudomonadales bacterium]|nr:AMP-binding protein [Pseudomonadales bacterium]